MSGGSINVRRLAAGDEQVLTQAMSALKGGYRVVGQSAAARFLAGCANYVFVAEAGGIPIGFSVAYELDRFDGDDTMMFLYEVEVAAEHRRKGAGTKLVGAVLDSAAQCGVRKVYVLSNKGNEAACALYRTTGATAVGDDDILFEWRARGTTSA